MKVVFTKAQIAAFEKYFGKLDGSSAAEKSRGPRGPIDYSRLKKVYRRDKDGVVRAHYVSREKEQIKQSGGQNKKQYKASDCTGQEQKDNRRVDRED